MTAELTQYALHALLAAGLTLAAITDLRSRRIGNRLTAAIASGAPLFWWASGLSLWPGVAIQLGVALAAFAVLALLFAIRAMGGGDVKLLTALALWVPPLPFLQLIAVMAIAGGVLTVLFGGWHVVRRRKGRVAVPYGLAIALAGLWVIGAHYGTGARAALGA